jgi:peptide/nickel transport system substrate-binding protein
MSGSMRSVLMDLVRAALGCLAMLGIASCGGGNPTSGGGGKAGGTITMAYSSFPDFLDPALAYRQVTWQTLWPVYTPLLTYRHAEGAEGTTLVPGLAEALPNISADGRTYRLKLRSGLKYSDGGAVQASDFEHAVKRVLSLESGGAAFYLGIQGAEKYVKDDVANADISGIGSDDKTGAITIHLTKPDGRFPYVLAMEYAGLVPGDTPFENQTKDPPPGVGPYKLENVRVNRGYDLVKVRGFSVPAQQVGKLDKIEVRVITSRRRQTQDVIQNKLDYMSDPPAPDQLRDVRARYSGTRYKEFVTHSTYYFFLNHRIAPFDKPEARQAVNYAVDKRALARLFGGLLEPGCNFLPPGMDGYQRIDPCPWGDPNAGPNLARAKQLIKQAGVAGQHVMVWGDNTPELSSVAQYLSDVLNAIGLKASPRIVEASVYFATIANQRTRAQIGFTGWFQDFPHPSDFLFLVDGTSIQSTNNQNVGNVDDPKINALLDKANLNANLDETSAAYAQADKLAVAGAHVVPFGHGKLTVFYSDRIDFDDCTVWHPVYNLDLTRLCLTARR